jgi:hypothetical protein
MPASKDNQAERRPATEVVGRPSFWRELLSSGGGRMLLAVSIVAIVALAAAVVLLIQTVRLTRTLAATKNDIARIEERTLNLLPGWVNTTQLDVQPLGMGFSVVDFSAKPVEAGIRVTGSIINGTSLDHHKAVFTVVFDDNREMTFTLEALLSGHSTAFDTVVGPAGNTSIPKKIRVLFTGSEVSYY